jgi:hypothetical protein
MTPAPKVQYFQRIPQNKNRAASFALPSLTYLCPVSDTGGSLFRDFPSVNPPRLAAPNVLRSSARPSKQRCRPSDCGADRLALLLIGNLLQEPSRLTPRCTRQSAMIPLHINDLKKSDGPAQPGEAATGPSRAARTGSPPDRAVGSALSCLGGVEPCRILRGKWARLQSFLLTNRTVGYRTHRQILGQSRGRFSVRTPGYGCAFSRDTASELATATPRASVSRRSISFSDCSQVMRGNRSSSRSCTTTMRAGGATMSAPIVLVKLQCAPPLNRAAR